MTAYREANFRTFDTICSATQDRQDAVDELLQEPLDVMLVVGGYNSSNTLSLAAICARSRRRAFHVEDAEGIDPSTGIVRYRPIGLHMSEVTQPDWMPATGPVRVSNT
ncbi:MAG: 4-hydroxy-3-methylbut-2-enyl diphosphate reductase, partial [Gemmatimonadaceae bacterium]|nr:4-hydroxy-3-methylbut-2-enyl diphosphate reductase [Gemmatimonadaceae bacterium]